MTEQDQAYAKGFMAKCAELGCDVRALIKAGGNAGMSAAIYDTMYPYKPPVEPAQAPLTAGRMARDSRLMRQAGGRVGRIPGIAHSATYTGMPTRAATRAALVGKTLTGGLGAVAMDAVGPLAGGLGAMSGSNPGLGNRARAFGQGWMQGSGSSIIGGAARRLGAATSNW